VAHASPSRQESRLTLSGDGPITRQPAGKDLFGIPGLRQLVRWKYARLVFQVPLLILAVFVIIDGLTGRQLAPRNIATTSVWLHYRGLLVLALALFGNAFCAACPLMLTRGATRRLKRFIPTFHWPRALQNKWLVGAFTLIYLFSYEYFDLWASPWLTAWLALGYFGSALVVDTIFPNGTFCRFVCPLGNFNFALSSSSPTMLTAIDHDLCRECVHKPCLHGRETSTERRGTETAAFIPLDEITNPNGEGYFPGCETDLFVPTLQSNMDCTNCFNCVRACPYDNVALTIRPPWWELVAAPWLRRGRLAATVFAVLLTYWGLLNAVAMIGPFFDVAQKISNIFSINSELVLLGTIFLLVTAGGLLATTVVATVSDLLGGAGFQPWQSLQRWGYVTLVLGVGFWSSHYLFHFLTGALSAIPVFQHFFEYRGFAIDPNWRLAQIVPTRWLFPVTASIIGIYTMFAIIVNTWIALRDFGHRGVVAMWPMLIFVLAFGALALLVLGQPMEMRGTVLGPSF
jgi:ferredoxin